MAKINIKKCLGLDIVDTGYDEFIDLIVKRLESNMPSNIMSINLTALKRYNSEFQFFVEKFDFTTADGKGFVIFSRFIGDKIKNHLSIPRLCEKLIDNFSLSGKKIFLLGAEEKVNRIAIDKLKNRYEKIKISGHHGYFDINEMSKILKTIEEFNPDLILVGISSPMKEKVILKISEKYNKSINIACGGYIDILSGKIKRAPEIIHKTGTEWLFRFYEEPKRMLGPMLINGFFFLLYIFPIALFTKYLTRKDPSILKIMNSYNKS